MIDLVYDVFDKPRDPLYESPEVADWLTSSGYKLAYDGTYKRITNIGGAQQIETMQPDQAKRLYQSQQYVLDAAQLPSSAPDYLSQIQGMLQASNQQQGGASSNQYSNPYEKRLAEIMNDPDQIANTNAYKFRFNQGQQALERSAAAKGMLNSGNTLSALADYGQGQASQEYDNEFNRLSQAVGQRNQYNLGRMGVANQELSARNQNLSNNAGVALKALTSADDVYNERKRLSLMAATGGGLLKSGPSNQYATW
jgi:uncharacterized protein YukE